MSESLALSARAAGVKDPRVLRAVARLSRRPFVPWFLRPFADLDVPLFVGLSRTTSQPSLTAFIAQELALLGAERVLEVGTGTGYEAALLASLVREVHTIEIASRVARRAAANLASLGFSNVHVHAADGALGWPSAAPFDRIVVAAATPEVPEPLLEELAPGGRLIVPVGRAWQEQTLRLIEKAEDGTTSTRDLVPVSYVALRRPARDAHRCRG